MVPEQARKAMKKFSLEALMDAELVLYKLDAEGIPVGDSLTAVRAELMERSDGQAKV